MVLLLYSSLEEAVVCLHTHQLQAQTPLACPVVPWEGCSRLRPAALLVPPSVASMGTVALLLTVGTAGPSLHRRLLGG